jgi:thiamine transport system substrate-binding protein
MNLIRVMPAEGAMPRVKGHRRATRSRMTSQPFPIVTLALVASLASLAILAAATALSSCARREEPELLVYTYDSFVSEWGPAPVIGPLLEKATGIKARFVSKGDGAQLLAALINERAAPKADVAVGIDNVLAPKALAAGLFEPYRPKGAQSIAPELVLDPDWRLSPYDYGHFAIIWDSERLAVPPESLADLASPFFARQLIVMDPRTSTPGLGLLAWAQAVYGESWRDYWRRLRPNLLAMTPGWDTGYGLFTKGEAPLVLSYATSPAYHKEYENTERYKALAFPEGHPVQIEGAGVLKTAPRPGNARAFLDFLLSPDCQAELPLTQWMYPVLSGVRLPESFGTALRPTKTLAADPERVAADAVEAAQIFSGDR